MDMTVMEMGEKTYVVYVRRGMNRRTVRMTQGLRDAIQHRGRRIWNTIYFGSGRLGEQAQYEISSK